MNLKQLRYFTAAAELGCMSLAAAAVRVAQSAVSSQIAALEAELGTRLLVRHSRGVRLTGPGRVLLDHAKRVDEAMLQAKRAVQAAASVRREVTLGIPVSISAALTLPLMRAIEEQLPGTQVRVYEGLTGDLRGWLRSGKVETAILYGNDDSEGLELVPLADDEIVLFGAVACVAAEGAGTLAFEDLARYPLFTTDEDHPVRPLLDRLAQLRGVALDFAGRINSVHQLKALAGSGRGFTMLPKVALAAELHGQPGSIHHIRPPIFLRSYIASPRSVTNAPNWLLGLIRQVSARLVADGDWPGAEIVACDQLAGPEINQRRSGRPR